MKKILMISFCLLFLLSAGAALAQNSSTVDIGNPLTGFTTQDDTQASRGLSFVQGRLGSLLAMMLRGLAVLSLLPIVFGGVMMITSQGNSEKVEKGKSALYWGFVGLTLAFMSIMLYSLLLRIILPA